MSNIKFVKAKDFFLQSLVFIKDKNYKKAEELLLKSYSIIDNRVSVITNLILVNVLQKKI